MMRIMLALIARNQLQIAALAGAAAAVIVVLHPSSVLAWIIAALAVAWIIVSLRQHRGEHHDQR
jgi:hypothetical protein